MVEQKNLKLAVKNFGPIREGEVEFKPLTVFIGPNNSGKSYMATLLYAMTLALIGKMGFPYTPRFASNSFSSEDVNSLVEWAKSLSINPTGEGEDIVLKVRSILRSYIDAERRELEVRVQRTLREYFSSRDLSELGYANSRNFSVSLFEERTDLPFATVGELKANINVEQDWYALTRNHVPRFIGVPGKDTQTHNFASDFSFILRNLWRGKLVPMGMPEGDVYYLPAGRTGLIQGWQLVASLAIGMIGPRIGTQDLEIPSFPGIARDFTQQLLGALSPWRDNGESHNLEHGISLLEERILQGRIQARLSNNIPTINYDLDGFQIPLQRTSSMISELAPIHIWMTHILKSGDVLIIDEPEAHLHPENQRLIAQVLVRLMNAGVRVVCTTHSSLILHQLSNQILATASDRLDAVGFTEHDKLNLEDVGVHLFEPSEDGVYVKEVEIDSDFGISEDEFVRVADQIGDETYQLVT